MTIKQSVLCSGCAQQWCTTATEQCVPDDTVVSLYLVQDKEPYLTNDREEIKALFEQLGDEFFSDAVFLIRQDKQGFYYTFEMPEHFATPELLLQAYKSPNQ